MPRKNSTNVSKVALVKSNAQALLAVATGGNVNRNDTLGGKLDSTDSKVVDEKGMLLVSSVPVPSTTLNFTATPTTTFPNSSLPGNPQGGVTIRRERSAKRVLSFATTKTAETNIEVGRRSDSFILHKSKAEMTSNDSRVCKAPRISSTAPRLLENTAPELPPLDLARTGEIVDHMMLEDTNDELHVRALGWDLALAGLKVAKAKPNMRFAVSLLQQTSRCSEANRMCNESHVFCALCSQLLCDCGSQATTTYTNKTTYYSASVSQFTMHKQNKSIWAPTPCDECESVIAGQPLCTCAMELGGVPTQADKLRFTETVWKTRSTVVTTVSKSTP